MVPIAKKKEEKKEKTDLEFGEAGRSGLVLERRLREPDEAVGEAQDAQFRTAGLQLFDVDAHLR